MVPSLAFDSLSALTDLKRPNNSSPSPRTLCLAVAEPLHGFGVLNNLVHPLPLIPSPPLWQLLSCCICALPPFPPPPPNAVAELLRVKGVPNILFWSEDPSGLVAAYFSSILFSALALEHQVTLLEAYALTLFATQVCMCVCAVYSRDKGHRGFMFDMYQCTGCSNAHIKLHHFFLECAIKLPIHCNVLCPPPPPFACPTGAARPQG
jgi:hypothetical protein